MKVFQVKVRVFGPRGFIPLKPADQEMNVQASAAHTAIYYALRELRGGALKGKRVTGFNIAVSELATLPKALIAELERKNG
jgi:hypothetical protein